uniref:Uncharacterized protein n=1 Tax=Brassica oleracea var. oleracea TaxID=109376 RepID=A0A0D3D2I0_BRAOL
MEWGVASRAYSRNTSAAQSLNPSAAQSQTSDSSLLPSSCVVRFSVRFNVYIPAGFS